MIVPDNMPSICPNNSYLASPPQPCETSNFWTNFLEVGPEGMSTVSPDTVHNTKLLGSGDSGGSGGSGPGGSGPGGSGGSGPGGSGPGGSSPGSGPGGSGPGLEASGGSGPGSGPGSNPGSRRKRETPTVNVEFQREAEFLQIFMDLEADVRYNIGHRIGSRMSELTSTEVTSMIKSCVYKGVSCSEEK